MKRGPHKRWSVDWSGDGEPRVGDIVRHVTAVTKVCSFWRVTDVRLVRHVAPLPEGCVARYKVSVEPRGEHVPQAVAWTLQAWPRKAKTPDTDKFSPLL